MSNDAIQERIKNLITGKVLLAVDPETIQYDSGLISDLGLDSIQIIGLVSGLEEEFDIVLEDEDLDFELFSTINSLATLVEKKLA